jgi:hypothetical protein
VKQTLMDAKEKMTQVVVAASLMTTALYVKEVLVMLSV